MITINQMDQLTNLAAISTIIGSLFIILGWVYTKTTIVEEKNNYFYLIGGLFYLPFFLVLILTLVYEIFTRMSISNRGCLPEDYKCQEYYEDRRQQPW